ncbi:malectin domain-containing carbohydrate-binding protein [uncultured Paludibaculum sp.]|uniref:malectin domain-containing carbohydrate-binding protein n=1 Tax=uncultured Paludibaculum sp. TaxID=1765020 RepID=UPI002AAA9D21|nr:malectin domain-containing carbohydrate-binding protein [uncultured Paludibaculum sp.]
MIRPDLSMDASEGIGLSEPEQQAVRTELNRLLESPAFRGSKRCRDFLKHVVEQTIAGPGDALKERSIGVDLFQLPPAFDPGQHTVVRVTANEIRKKLAQQYHSENGSAHPVRIELPPGSYKAEFKWEVSVAEPELPLPPKTLPRMAIAGGVVLLALAGGFAISQWRMAKSVATDVKAVSTPSNLPPIGLGGGSVRIIVGSSSSYVDRSGRAWSPDRLFSGGSVFVRPSERVLRTLDPDIYRHMRQGDFRYDIPLAPGKYELHLHFAETGLSDLISAESSGEGQRVFQVSANGNRILNFFDVVADAAGANIADERVFRDIAPAPDGLLHLSFAPQRGTAMLSAIEVLPVSPGKVRPVRIRAGWTSSWQDSAGQQWQADSYFMGGNALVRNTNPAQAGNSIQPDVALYASERWGHFSYSIPVADGLYRVALKFNEGHYGRRNTGVGGLGSRIFDVYCNGAALLRNFDIMKAAGGEGRPLDRAFSGVRPTAQGKIVLTFVPVEGMACVNGIEVLEESN